MKNVNSIFFAAGFLQSEIIMASYQGAGYVTGKEIRLLTGDLFTDAAIAVASAVAFVALGAKAIEGICDAPKKDRLGLFLISMLMGLIGLLVGTACINVVWLSQVAHIHASM